MNNVKYRISDYIGSFSILFTREEIEGKTTTKSIVWNNISIRIRNEINNQIHSNVNTAISDNLINRI